MDLCCRLCVCVRMGAGTNRDQERVSDLLKQELWVAVTCLAWVLKTKLRSPAVAVSTNGNPQTLNFHFKISLRLCGSLNVIDPCNLINDGTIRRYGFVTVGMVLLEEVCRCRDRL